ncbi:MAG: gliding motility-associated C-terminal domain-containing protein, partial [Bacteroidia bacterium]
SGNITTKWVKIAGYYHVIVTDNNGCVLTSNTVEVKKYNTPFLSGIPSVSICPNGSTVLKVFASDTTLIQWLAPLSGGGTVKTVTATGIYSCQVTMCNITTICTIEVHPSIPTASISVSQYSFCPGDSIVLYGNPNMSSYLWLPSNSINSVLPVFEGGQYTLTTTDANGCTASATISVSMYSLTPVPIPSVNSLTICYGTSTVLSATGSGTINWYANQTGGLPFFTGNSYSTPTLVSQATYYISNSDPSHICPSNRIPIHVYIEPASLPVTASVQTANLCNGDSLKFFSPTLSNLTYNWSGPNSFTSNQQNPFIFPAGPNNTGSYSFWTSANGCTSNTVVLNVVVNAVSMPNIIGNFTICEGSSISLSVSPSNTNTNYFWYGPNSYTASGSSIFIASATSTNNGGYQVIAELNNCSSEPNTFNVSVLNNATVTSISPFTGCEGDSIIISVSGINISSTSWTGPNNFSGNSNPLIIYPASLSNIGSYTFVASNNPCASVSGTVPVNLFPNPQVNLGPDTTLCFQFAPTTLTVSNFPTIFWQDNSTANSYNIYNTPGTYSVFVVDSNGCKNSDIVTLNFIECDTTEIPSILTPNNDGKNDFLKIKSKFKENRIEVEIYNRWGHLVYKDEDYNDTWSGKCNVCSGSEKLPVGTYYYIIKLPDFENKIFKGFITVIY